MPEQQIPLLTPPGLRHEHPADLFLIVAWLAAAIGVIYLTPTFTQLRVALALPVILFVPGYSLLAALFPKKGDIDPVTRIVLSIGLSIAIVPLIGLGLNFSPWGIRLDPIVTSITLFSLVMIVVVYYQRAVLPSEEQFGMTFSGIAAAFRRPDMKKDGRSIDRILTVALSIAILITIVIAVYVITVPREGEKYTEFFILGENRTAADYPYRIVPGQEYSMYVGVRNHEYRDVPYTIETWLLHTEFDNVTNSSLISAMDPNDRLSFTLAHNETRLFPYPLSVGKSGYNRVEFLLFKDTVYGPELTGSDRINASYRDLHLKITVP